MTNSARGDGKGLVQRLAEGLSVVTAIAFLVSAFINSAIFFGWGVAFLSIATPTDVLMSGLQLLLYAVLLLAYIWMLATTILPKAANGERLATFKRGFIKFARIFSALAFLYVAMSAGRFFWPRLPPAQHFQFLALCSLTFVVLTVLDDIATSRRNETLAVVALDHLQGSRKIEVLSRGGWFYGALFAGSVAVFLATTVFIASFVPARTWYDGPGASGCAPLRVLWIGQSTLLVQCPEGGQVRVVSRTDAGTLLRVSDERPPAIPPPAPQPSAADGQGTTGRTAPSPAPTPPPSGAR